MNGFAAVELTPAHVWIAALSQAATGSLVAAVWQGILLAAAAGLGLRLLPKTPAAVRFAIWFAVFAVVVALPVISFLPHAGGEAGVGGHAWLTLDARWSLVIAAVWLTASLIRATTLAVAAFRVRALWKRAAAVEINGASAGSRRAQVCTSHEVDRPTVIGFFAPKILIPGWLLEKLTAAELEQIVLHETGHLGRADDWMNLLQKIALVVFPLNPALAWVERRLCFERELACDERVLRQTGAPKAYAACLATLAEYRLERRGMPLGLALVLGALGRESELGRRVSRILRRGERMKPLHVRLVLGGAMLGLLVGVAGLERCPQLVGFAQGGSDTVAAHEQQWLPTQVAGNAMNGGPGLATTVNGRSIRALGVVYKAAENKQIPLISDVAHQTSATAAGTGSRQGVDVQAVDAVQRPVERATDSSARMVQTSARLSGTRNPSRTVSDAEPEQPANVMMQWVVVTTWQDGQATRVVFTTARTADATAQATTDPGTAGEQTAPTEQGPSYAAVPVRGGWLVFQL